MTNVLTFNQTFSIPIVAFTEAIAQWQQRMNRRGKADNTVKAYTCDVIDAARHFARRDIHVVGVLSAHDIESWIDDMCVRQLSPRSQARRITALRRFLDYCMQERWCTSNAASDTKVKFRMHKVTAPEAADLMRVITAIPERGDWKDLRDRALLRLAFDAALRAGGVASVDVPWSGTERAIDLKKQYVCVSQKGGGTTDPIAIGERTVEAINAWLQARKDVAKPGEVALFVSRRGGGRLDRRTMHQICRRRGAAAGLPNLHIHLFRHRRIGDLIEQLGLHTASTHAQHAHASTTATVYGAHAGSVVRKVIRERASLDRHEVAA